MEANYLHDILILLGAAVIIVPVFQYSKLSAVLGFMVAGVLIGPSVAGLITNVSEIRHLSELGVVFLLFIIGVELKPSRLWLMRRMVFGLGSLQVVITGAAITALAMALGIAVEAALIIGFGLALSSTAFVLQILSEYRELTTEYGRASFAVLLLQDLAVVPLLALIPLLAAPEDSFNGNIGLALAKIVIVVAVVIIGGRYLLRPVLHQVARHGSPEIFAAMAVLLVLGMATLTAKAGLSMAMGAFVAGLLIADSEFRHQIMADIQPFRGFLLGLFFMAVGMSIDIRQLSEQPYFLLGVVGALLAVKSMLLWLLCRLFGLSKKYTTAVALLLAQGGEFAFILFAGAFDQGLLPEALFQQLILIAALSMAMTPFLAWAARRIVSAPGEQPKMELAQDPHEHQVIIAGFGRVGRRIATLLDEASIPYTAIECKPDRVAEGRARGCSVFYGDASRPDVFKAANVGKAAMVLVTLDDTESAKRIVAALRSQYPELPLYARGSDRSHCEELLKMGASATVSENLETSLQLGHLALTKWGIPDSDSTHLVEAFRQRYYHRFAADRQSAAGADELDKKNAPAKNPN